ncbi:LIC_10190 family membrane protein [Hyunsoonleella ulvae]|uniref:LIC_10190 family membrane protein n=1 Tax=Hyunsoonleella ulvae TaxID=2799948 RepID=UPI0037443D9F
MLLILLSWIYIALTCLNFGFVFRRILKIDNCHFTIHHILGLFLYTITTSLAAFFMRIHIEYYVSVLILNCILLIWFRADIKQLLNSVWHAIKNLKTPYKLLYLLLCILVLAQSATKPYLIDNESYYIQTIKWINEFGYVKGLANLHLFLGQNSSWHALQAGFNFPFITNCFNDINGFIFVLLGFLFIEKLNHNSNVQDYFLGLILVFSLFLMQFVNTPSPDLIIFLLTPYVVYEFLMNYNTISINTFKQLLSIVLFLCLVKVTMLVVSLLILILFLKHYNALKIYSIKFTLLCIGILGLFLFKNYIISGYLFYPTSALDILNVDWKLPPELLQLYKTGTYQSGFNNIDTSSFSFLETLKYWLQIPKLNGLFNKLFLFLLVLFPFCILKSKHKTQLLIVYLLGLVQLVIVWLNSPQYRFFFVFIVIFSLQIFVTLFKSQKLGLYLTCSAIILSAITIFIPLNLNAFTSNKFAMTLSNFKFKNIIIPENNTKTATTFSKVTVDGFDFYTPEKDVFFWGTGNGSLPCVNQQQVEYIKHYYHYIPKLRGNSLKDGFMSKKTNP